MTSSPPTKIVLKSTTKMSLNDRFSAYRMNTKGSVASIRQKIQQQRQASARNRRLVQQMENRPSVIAALKLKKRSLMQRLGQTAKTGVKARLSLGNAREGGGNRPIRGGNRGNLRGNRGMGRGNRGNIQRKGFKPNALGSGIRTGSSPLVKARLGNQNMFGGNRGNRPGGRGNRRGRGRGGGRGNFQNRGNFRDQNRGNRGQRGNWFRRPVGGRGRGRGRGINQKVLPTKQELDNQLDEYMSKTKNPLDEME